MILSRLTLCLVIFCCFPAVSYGKISVYRDGSVAIISVLNTILENDAADFKLALQQNLNAQSIQVFLASDGGSVDAAIKIGRMIRAVEVPVEVPPREMCASSCALIFFGGVDRSSYGKIGIHRPYFSIFPTAAQPSDADINQMYSDVEAYLKEMRVPPQVFQMMMLKSPEDMQVFEGDAVFSSVPTVDPTTDERRTTFLARRYGLDTLSYRRIRVQAESICAATFLTSDTQEDIVLKVVVAGNCVEAYLWGVPPERGEAMKAQIRESCILSDQYQKDFLGYKADVLMRALEAHGRDEMELDWYGFPPGLEHNECVRRVYGR